MKRKYIPAAAAVFSGLFMQGQNLIPIPDTLSGGSVNLVIADSVHQFYIGYNSTTIAYNGSYLGPTLFLNKGQQVSLNVTNQLNDTTTTHWHGLHVEPMNDGSPHNPILAGTTWSPSFTVMDNAGTYWYHPHLHGKTMDQVLLGAAGLIIVKDPAEAALALPRTYGVDDIPLVCQFQTMDTVTKQIVIDDEFDNVTLVNGTLNPMVNVPAQVVRLRLLNASSLRVLQFGFNDNRTFYVIGSDDGLLNAPVPVTRIRIGSGERYEILADFSGQTGNTYYINQYGNELPAGYPGGAAMMNNPIGPLDDITFSFLQINVVAPTTSPVTAIPATLVNNIPWSTVGAGTMNFSIQGQPMMSMTNFVINGQTYNEQVINFTKNLNDVMIWNITNQSMMAHPFHIHGNHFFILSVNGNPPPAEMQGRKDVVLVGPMNGSAQVIMKYEDFADSMMPYMYHCHILSHEDNGMMGQFIINPAPSAVSEFAAPGQFTVFPSPADESVTLQFDDRAGIRREIEVMEITGKIIATAQTGNVRYQLETAAWSNGTYFVRVRTGDQTAVKKITISH